MKSYEEIAQNIFRRRDEYLMKKKRKRTVWKRKFCVSVGMGLTALVAIGIWNNDAVKSTVPCLNNDPYVIIAETIIGGENQGTEPQETTGTITVTTSMGEYTDVTYVTTSAASTSSTTVTTVSVTSTVTDTTTAAATRPYNTVTATTTANTTGSLTAATATTTTIRTTTTPPDNPVTTTTTKLTGSFTTTTTTTTIRTTTTPPDNPVTTTTTTTAPYIDYNFINSYLSTITDSSERDYDLGSTTVPYDELLDVIDMPTISVNVEDGKTIRIIAAFYEIKNKSSDEYVAVRFEGITDYWLYRRKM